MTMMDRTSDIRVLAEVLKNDIECAVTLEQISTTLKLATALLNKLHAQLECKGAR